MNPSQPLEGGLVHSFSRDVVSAATTFLCCEGVFFEPAPTCSLCPCSSRLGFFRVFCVFLLHPSLLAVYTVRRLHPFICNSLLSSLSVM